MTARPTPPTNVPTTPSEITGGPVNLWAEGGYGLDGGVPRGETEQTRVNDHNRLYKFRPGAAARLRSATARAIGRRR